MYIDIQVFSNRFLQHKIFGIKDKDYILGRNIGYQSEFNVYYDV